MSPASAVERVNKKSVIGLPGSQKVMSTHTTRVYAGPQPTTELQGAVYRMPSHTRAHTHTHKHSPSNIHSRTHKHRLKRMIKHPYAHKPTSKPCAWHIPSQALMGLFFVKFLCIFFKSPIQLFSRRLWLRQQSSL